MLSMYGSLKVPGVDHVELYRDDEDNSQFYMITDLPSVAKDDEGDPLFTFILYARDLDRLNPDEAEIERGYLALTTQVAVSKEDEDKIRDYLRKQLKEEKARGYGFLRQRVNSTEPKLGYPPAFVNGAVKFSTFGDDMVEYSGGSTKPSLMGTNVASFSQTLKQDGAELFRASLTQGVTPAIINYELTYLARIPALTIHIHGNRRKFYDEVKEYVRKTYTRTKKIFGITYYKRTWSWWEFSGMKKFKDTFHSLKIDIDDQDFRTGEEGEELSSKLEELAFKILENNILPTFFEPALKEIVEEEDGEVKDRPTIQETVTGTIDIWIKRSDVVQRTVYPSATFTEVLDEAEIAKHIVYLDLSEPMFKDLDVKVHANVDFENDPVYALKVFLDYDQHDDVRDVRIRKAKEFLFRSADQVHRFRTIMAKEADQAVKDTYSYWSEIVYKGTGETIRVPANGSLDTKERELVISYRRLGFVKVAVNLGPMPDQVDSATVRISYPYATSATAQKVIELSRDHPVDGYFTFIGHQGDPKPYRYQITYKLTDGQKMDMPEAESQSEVLTVSDPFEQTLNYRFLAQADFDVVEKILVDARYIDDGNDYRVEHSAELMSNGEVSPWNIPMRNPLKRDIEFDVIVIYRDGSRDDQATRTHVNGGTVSVGVGAVDTLSVMVDAGLVDWDTYARVIVSLEYTDDAHKVDESEDLMIRESNCEQLRTWKVLLRDPNKTSYRFRIRYIGVNKADDREEGWQTTEDTILVVR